MKGKKLLMTAVLVSGITGVTLAGCGNEAALPSAGNSVGAGGAEITEGDSGNSGSEGGSMDSDIAKEETTGDNSQVSTSDYEVTYDGIEKAVIDAGAAVHDPSIIQDGDKYYIFGSHMTGAVTEDLRKFKYIGNGYVNGNKVFDHLLSDDEAFAYTGSADSLIPTDDGGRHVWAEDVTYNKTTGLYYMYFCTTSTWNASNLCYATSANIEGPYKWQGALIYSGITADTIDATDVTEYVDRETAIARYTTKSGREYNFNEYPNAIDPAVFYDEDDRLWMVYGSWSGGIYLIELNAEGTECIHPVDDPDRGVDAYFGKRLIGGKHRSIEGPWIQYDKEAGYYYLFVSYGGLNREGGYQIRVFRSSTVDGEYVDMFGNSCEMDSGNHSYQGLKLSGNYYLPSLDRAYMATGHNSAMIDENDGKRYICYHTRFDDGQEDFKDRVKQYFINTEGWPVMLPYATDGETISSDGYDKSELAGRYYMVNQGTGIDSEIAQPVMVDLLADGSVKGDGIEGSWTAEDGSAMMTITCGDVSRQNGEPVTYSGVFCAQNDEAGTPVMTFTAAGDNQSLWGVKY